MGSRISSHDCADAARLQALLLDGDVDAAIEGGLMDFLPCDACERLAPDATALLRETREQLLKAWAARDRYRARNARLAQRAAERETRRGAAATPSPTPTSTPDHHAGTLPPAVAAALARAKARAAGRHDA